MSAEIRPGFGLLGTAPRIVCVGRVRGRGCDSADTALHCSAPGGRSAFTARVLWKIHWLLFEIFVDPMEEISMRPRARAAHRQRETVHWSAIASERVAHVSWGCLHIDFLQRRAQAVEVAEHWSNPGQGRPKLGRV